MAQKQNDLFPEHNKARHGESRRWRNLFLPNYLRADSGDFRLRGKDHENAYQIILKWADMESGGKLQKMNETALQGDFIADVFGTALGYTRFSEDLDHWEIREHYSLPDGQEADAAIGYFSKQESLPPRVLVEFKGPTVNVDRQRFNGRTPVQQCWDYLNVVPECPWGIVCNFVSFRLYRQGHTSRAYQLFTLQDLRKEEVFRQFYYLFERGGLLPITKGQLPRADVLLEKTSQRQREVGDDLYRSYSDNRDELIRHLRGAPHKKPLESAIRIAQKLLDRIVFVAFCEDRDLLPANSIRKAWTELRPFSRVTNPRWQNFLDLFGSIDKGDEARGISPYNGGLFREDDEVDNLDLDDRWTNFFNNIRTFNFRDAVHLDVLGHLFERSVNDIEQIRRGGLYDEKSEEKDPSKMSKSAKRKRGGIYYTPPEFTEFITHNTVAKLAEERFQSVSKRYGIEPEWAEISDSDPKIAKYWREIFEALRQIKIVDPACGSGAFLIRAYDVLEEEYLNVVDHLAFHDERQGEELRSEIPGIILRDNLFGVDLSPEAVEITQLALWIRSAHKGKTLADLSGNIVRGNSLVTDPDVHPLAMEWEKKFPEIFSRENPGFDCVIGNPPWERMKLQEREFFDLIQPNIAAAVNAATRRKLIAELEEAAPDMYRRYIDVKTSAENTLDHVRASGRFPLTGKGDINTYAVFAELARNIVSPTGRVGLLVPSGIATDHTTRTFFAELIDSRSLAGLYDFENKAPFFPDVHRSFKFCALLFGGSQKKSESADYVFFARHIEELKDKARHIELSADDLKLLNPNTRTCPIFRSRHDAELTKAIYRRVPILVDKTRKEGGNPWGIKFLRMFDQTNDAELFHAAEQLKAKRFKRDGACWRKGKKTFLPLYEAKMIQAYDHRAASVIVKSENWFRQGQTAPSTLVEHQNREFSVVPRWWAEKEAITDAFKESIPPALMAFKNVTSPTNQRTMIASFIPAVGVINSAPLIRFDENISPRLQSCLLANLNAFVLDYVARQKIGNVNLNFFLVEQFPVFPPDVYGDRCPWDRRRTLEKWISDRVLKLTCTSNDMKPLAKAAGFDPPVHKWKPEERAELQSQLDAAYFLLYGLQRDDVEYVLSTFTGARKEGESMFGDSTPFERVLMHYDQMQEQCGEKSRK